MSDIARKKKIAKEIDSIIQKRGKGSVFQVGTDETRLNVPRLSTGIEVLDYVMGGGIPIGRQVEIYGLPSSGKTTLGYYLASLYTQCVYFPIEGTYDEARAISFGNGENMYVFQGIQHGEDLLNQVGKLSQAGIEAFFVDSVPFIIPKHDNEKIDKAQRNNTIENKKIASTAGLLTTYVPRITLQCETTGTTGFWINQVREKMDAQPFGEKYYTMGGKMHEHCQSVRLQTVRRAWIECTNYDPRNSASKEKVGIIIKVKCMKNKLAPPFREGEICYVYDHGFMSHEDAKQKAKEIGEERKAFFKNSKNWRDELPQAKEKNVDEWDDEDWEDDTDNDW